MEPCEAFASCCSHMHGRAALLLCHSQAVAVFETI